MQLRGPYDRPEFNFHIKIETSLSGIAQVLQSSPEQIVCVDNAKTLKFYDFVDRKEQQREADFQKEVAAFSETLKEKFQAIDKDNSGLLDILEAEPLANLLVEVRCARKNLEMNELEKSEAKEELYRKMDLDGSGFISFHEMKVFLTRKYIEIHQDE